jgi:glycosyltransferase involved in cell wall biosynthesis
MQFVFWACVGFVVYAYLGYLAVLLVAARSFPREVRRADITPPVSFIIAARNEAVRIAEKIENTLAVDYPHERFEIIVTSDCSDDGTDAIVQVYADRGVRLVRSPERRGKEYAQGLAIAAARGDILVFSDAATRLMPDGVREIVKDFADPTVGCVSSVDRVIGADGQPSGEGLYVRYEMLLRALESRVGSVVGLSGSFFAARRSACEPWAPDLPSDFGTLLNTLRLRMRGVSDARAVGIYRDLSDPAAEYRRKVRTVARGISSLGRHLHLLDPLRYRMAAFQLFSHKLCRWLVPFAMAGCLGTSGLLAWRSPFYAVMLAVQVVAYLVTLVGAVRPALLRGPVRVLAFFVIVNWSILVAWYAVLRGRRVVTWQPSAR